MIIDQIVAIYVVKALWRQKILVAPCVLSTTRHTRFLRKSSSHWYRQVTMIPLHLEMIPRLRLKSLYHTIMLMYLSTVSLRMSRLTGLLSPHREVLVF